MNRSVLVHGEVTVCSATFVVSQAESVPSHVPRCKKNELTAKQ